MPDYRQRFRRRSNSHLLGFNQALYRLSYRTSCLFATQKKPDVVRHRALCSVKKLLRPSVKGASAAIFFAQQNCQTKPQYVRCHQGRSRISLRVSDWAVNSSLNCLFPANEIVESFDCDITVRNPLLLNKTCSVMTGSPASENYWGKFSIILQAVVIARFVTPVVLHVV